VQHLLAGLASTAAQLLVQPRTQRRQQQHRQGSLPLTNSVQRDDSSDIEHTHAQALTALTAVTLAVRVSWTSAAAQLPQCGPEHSATTSNELLPPSRQFSSAGRQQQQLAFLQQQHSSQSCSSRRDTNISSAAPSLSPIQFSVTTAATLSTHTGSHCHWTAVTLSAVCISGLPSATAQIPTVQPWIWYEY
jgi:hypothetical protein